MHNSVRKTVSKDIIIELVYSPSEGRVKVLSVIFHENNYSCCGSRVCLAHGF